MNKEQAAEFQAVVNDEVHATERFLRNLNKHVSAGQSDVAAFDSMIAIEGESRDAGFAKLPASLQVIMANEHIRKQPQVVFDGLQQGIEEYKLRNGGDEPSADVVAASFMQAAKAFMRSDNIEDNQATFDSLSLSHHEATSVVPAAVQVIIAYGISNSLPIVSMLPNPTGSNEVPIVYGTATAGMDMGVMRRGDLMDGDKAGLPYLENIHTLTMDQGEAGAFSLTSHVAYSKEVAANRSTKFVVDTDSQKAPFLGGRVTIMVKGVAVASDNNRNHPTTTGISTLQPFDKIDIGNKGYKVLSATANLDTHVIDVQFDTTNGDAPEADDVTAEIVFDYERVDNNGMPLLRAPSTDMKFAHESIYAHPSRSRSVATIDAITQLANELGINWYAAAQIIVMQRYTFEQTARLLRTAANICLADQDARSGRLITFDFNKTGISPTDLKKSFANVTMSLGLARTRLSKLLNAPVSGYDIYVSELGAAFFSGLPADTYESTGQEYGDNYTVYRIGTMKNSGANVYYLPESMGVFNEDEGLTTSHALIVARSSKPAQAAFVGTIAVPPMVLTATPSAFNREVATYSRIGAQVNPVKRFRNQFVLLEMINLPKI